MDAISPVVVRDVVYHLDPWFADLDDETHAYNMHEYWQKFVYL